MFLSASTIVTFMIFKASSYPKKQKFANLAEKHAILKPFLDVSSLKVIAIKLDCFLLSALHEHHSI